MTDQAKSWSPNLNQTAAPQLPPARQKPQLDLDVQLFGAIASAKPPVRKRFAARPGRTYKVRDPPAVTANG